MKGGFGTSFRNLTRISCANNSFLHRSTNSPHLRMVSSISSFRVTPKVKEWAFPEQTPTCMVFSPICLLPTMENGAHLMGSTAGSLLASEEEEDTVMGKSPLSIMRT